MAVVFVILAFVLGSIGLSWLVYFGMRLAAAGRADQETRDLAGGLVRGIGAVQGLVLAFVFSHQIAEHQHLREALVSEAVAVGDIYYDIDRYGASSSHEVQTALVDYVRHVAQVEWDELARSDRLSQHAWDLRETVYVAVLDLEPKTLRQEALRDHMIAKVQLIAELRWQRESASHGRLGPAFWIGVYAGLALVSAAYFTYAPRAINLVLLAFYAGFLGLLMSFIFALSNPFAEPARLEPSEFTDIFAGEFGEIIRAGRR